jgi:hypothetical protein
VLRQVLHVLLRHRLLPQSRGCEGVLHVALQTDSHDAAVPKVGDLRKTPRRYGGAPLPDPVPWARVMARTRSCSRQRHASISSAMPVIRPGLPEPVSRPHVRGRWSHRGRGWRRRSIRWRGQSRQPPPHNRHGLGLDCSPEAHRQVVLRHRLLPQSCGFEGLGAVPVAASDSRKLTLAECPDGELPHLRLDTAAAAPSR